MRLPSAPALVLFAAAAATTALHADVLTFDGNICSAANDGSGALTICPNGSAINQSYGDTANVNVTYLAGAVPGISMQRWDNGYSNLSNVAYGYFGAGFASILLTPGSGMQVTLNSFNLGTVPANVSRDALVTITDLGTNATLFTANYTNAGGNPISAIATLVSPGVTSAGGLRITYTGDVFNIGIDNVDFNATAIPTGAVPEPSTLGLVAAATLAGAGVLSRRNRNRS
jgi:hypothetical protein